MVKSTKKQSLLVFLRAQLSAQFATLVDFILTFVCFRWFGLYYLLATSIGSIAGGIINCIINLTHISINFAAQLIKTCLLWI